MSVHRSAHRAFTLIELLVVIAIIGLLATLAVVSFGNARQKARTAAAQAEMKQFMNAVMLARQESGKVLGEMTGRWCSVCTVCEADVHDAPDTHDCVIRWYNALTQVQANAGGVVQGLDAMKRDPWGSPYSVDENEWEWVADPCRIDAIFCAGPDGRHRTGDDIIMRIPNFDCP